MLPKQAREWQVQDFAG